MDDGGDRGNRGGGDRDTKYIVGDGGGGIGRGRG